MNNTEQREFNRKCLYLGLMKLLEEKSMDKITIGELCEYSGVSRMTFYRSYNFKEDIMLQHLEECFSRFLQSLEETHCSDSHYEVALQFFRFWQTDEKEFLSALVRNGLSGQLMERFYHYLSLMYQNVSLLHHTSEYIRSFLAGGLYKLLVDWTQEKFTATPEELAELLSVGGVALQERFIK